MDDLTIIYYTANRIDDTFADKVRQHLLGVVGDTPIISVSFKPIDFGVNVVFGDPRPSAYNVYKQVLVGARIATTRYIACAEDDTLYTPEHFLFRPPDDTFAYNDSHHDLYKDVFIYRRRCNMATCIAPTKLMLDTLELRFKKYPYFMDSYKGETHGFSEPGRHEHELGLPPVKMMAFQTDHAPVVFWHRPSLGGVRKILDYDELNGELPYWGNALDLWNAYYKRPEGYKWRSDDAINAPVTA